MKYILRLIILLSFITLDSHAQSDETNKIMAHIVLVNYNFFSKLYADHYYRLHAGLSYTSNESYDMNFIGGGISIGKYMDENMLLVIECSINNDYVSNEFIPKSDKPFLIHLDYSKIFYTGLTANIYYYFNNDNIMKYYIGIGTGVSRIYSVNDNFHIFPAVIQGRAGIKYINTVIGTPYLGYKYIYIKDSISDYHQINLSSHNFEFGLEIAF